MATAYIFPGQGSQSPGMGKDLADNFSAARQVFEEADDVLGYSLSDLCFSGSSDELQLTEQTQPALLTVAIATDRAMEAEGFPRPDYVAGHSLGEYSALVAAKSLSLADALITVRARGRYMQRAVPVGTGAMAAILDTPIEAVESACAEARGDQVCAPANINSPRQIVIAGNTEAVDRVAELLKDRGTKRIVKLKVSAPFHCSLMLPAQEQLAIDLNLLSFRDLRIPLVTNVDAVSITSGTEARDALVRQVSSPVRWLESIGFLLAQGVVRFIEVGPGKVLTGLVRQTSANVKCFNVGDLAGLTTVREELETC